MLSQLRARLSFANVVSVIALFVALGGTSYAVATGSIDSRELKNNTVRSKDLRNNDIRGRDIRDGTVRSRDVGNASLLAEDFAPGQLPQGAQGPQGPAGVVGNLTVQRLDLPLPAAPGNAAGSVACPAGEKIIAGSVNLSNATSDANITVSRPSQGAGQQVPDSGEGFDRWRGAAVGGTSDTTLRVWAICTPGTQQSVPGTGPGGD